MRWWQAALILTANFACANWKLLTGNAFERWDAFELGAPYYSLLADFIRAGRLLYWNPWLACGSPDFAVAGSGTFSPDQLLLAAMTGSGRNAYVIYWLTIWLAGGFGILFLARHLRAPAWGGLVVALGFVFSGFYTGHAEHSTVVYSYSLLPFIIWRVDAAILRRKFLPAAQAGVLWGLSGLGGYPALTIFTIGLIVAWACGRWFTAAKNERSFQHLLLSLGIIGAIGVVVLSPSYISAAYEGRGYSDRSEPLSRDFAMSSNALQPSTLTSLSSPALVGIAIQEFEEHRRVLWAKTDLSSANLYTGSITLLLALLALTNTKERRWRFYLIAVALLALACAMSDALPLRGWLYDFVPPTRYFRHASMLRGYALFLLSVLALLGAKDVTNSLRKLTFLAPIVAIGSGLVFTFVLAKAEIGQPQPFLAITHLLILQGGLIFLAFALHRRLTSAVPYLPALLVFLAIFDGLIAIHFTQSTLTNNGARPRSPIASETSIALGSQKFGRAVGSPRVNANFVFKIPTAKNYTPFRNWFHERITGDPALLALALGKQRLWFAEAPEVTPTQEVFAHFVRRWAELEAPLVLRHSRHKMMDAMPATADDFTAVANAPAAIAVESKIISYQPNALVLEMEAPGDGYLMVTDRWSRSWHATVNGVEQPIEGANFIFRAVPVAKGMNHVEFSYQPLGMPGLVLLSWSIVGLILALSLARISALNFRLTSPVALAPAFAPATK